MLHISMFTSRQSVRILEKKVKYLSHVDKYLTLKYKYKYKYSDHKYKYFEMVLEYYSSTSTSTKYYISANGLGLWLELGVRYSSLVRCIIKCNPCNRYYILHLRLRLHSIHVGVGGSTSS